MDTSLAGLFELYTESEKSKLFVCLSFPECLRRMPLYSRLYATNAPGDAVISASYLGMYSSALFPFVLERV